MSNIPNYGCTRCQRPVSRGRLTVKKALFTEMGMGGRTLRARVTDWLCPTCLEVDPDYLREKFAPPRIVSELHAS